MFIVSMASAIGSASVIAPILLFYKELREKPYMMTVLYVSVSNFLNSLGTAMGEPKDDSEACWFQGVVTNVFSLSSILWTATMTGILYQMLVPRTSSGGAGGGEFRIRPWMHVVCWGMPWVATLLPLADLGARYGSPPSGVRWCWLAFPENAPRWHEDLWFWASFYGWVWISIVGMTLALALTFFRIRGVMPSTAAKFRGAYIKLAGYPAMLLLTLSGPTIVDFLIYSFPSVYISLLVDEIHTLLNCSLGALVSVYFWTQETRLRRQMQILYHVGFSMEKYEALMRLRRERRIVGAGFGRRSVVPLSDAVLPPQPGTPVPELANPEDLMFTAVGAVDSLSAYGRRRRSHSLGERVGSAFHLLGASRDSFFEKVVNQGRRFTLTFGGAGGHEGPGDQNDQNLQSSMQCDVSVTLQAHVEGRRRSIILS